MPYLGSSSNQTQSYGRWKLSDWIEVVSICEIVLLLACLGGTATFPKLAPCAKWAFYLNAASMLAFLGVMIVQLVIEWIKELMTPLP